MPTYYVIVTCRNSEKNIEEALLSIFNQSVKPSYMIVIDDGSTDRTPRILSRLKERISGLHIITNPDLGYDIGRVVSNWNKAIRLSYDLQLEKTDYHMIATDDTVYEENYVEKIFKFLDLNQHIVIASGTFDDTKYATPHGAGRLINNIFFGKIERFYPEIIGYESFILYAARYQGYDYAVVSNARFEHTRKLGSDHNFYDWGQSMKALGYHPLFVLVRCLLYFIKNKPIGRLGSIVMFYKYLTYRPLKEGYYSLYQKEVRDYISKIQVNHMKEDAKKLIMKKLNKIPGIHLAEKMNITNLRTLKT